MTTSGSLFSGYEGLGQAVNTVFGTQTIWHSEIDKAACKVLAHRFSDIPNLGDITRIDWSSVPRVRVISGGSPCQDISHAGARRGMVSGTRSGLWESMREGIAVLRPQYVVWENVKGALSAKAASESDVEREQGRVGIRALGRVLGDLASLGYDAVWGTFRASDTGLPHRRERVFVLASHPENIGSKRAWELGPQATGPGPDRRATSSTVWLGENRDLQPEPLLPSPTVKYRWRLNPRFSEWVMGIEPGWITDVPGVSSSDALKMTGNGVSPPQAELAIRTLLAQFESIGGIE